MFDSIKEREFVRAPILSTTNKFSSFPRLNASPRWRMCYILRFHFEREFEHRPEWYECVPDPFAAMDRLLDTGHYQYETIKEDNGQSVLEIGWLHYRHQRYDITPYAEHLHPCHLPRHLVQAAADTYPSPKSAPLFSKTWGLVHSWTTGQQEPLCEGSKL